MSNYSKEEKEKMSEPVQFDWLGLGMAVK